MHRTLSKLAIVGAAFAVLIGLSILTTGQPGPQNRGGVVDDWSFHHLVFSNAGTAADALAQGRFEQWYRTVNDPRYIMQQMKRNPDLRAMATAPDFATLAARLSAPIGDRVPIWRHPPPTPRETLKRDWEEPLGSYTSSPTAAGQYPAKYSFSYTSGTCSDYVIYPTGVTGSGTQAAIVAYTNLYGTSGPSGTGCGSGSSGGAVPKVYWAYNAPVSSTDGIATLSPVIDWSGTQVAFVETVSGTAYLVLLRMANSGSTVTTPTYESTASAYYNSGAGCAAPCYTTFSLGATDTNSPPFYDYANDRMYVGDDAGKLHQFTTVFRGTPAVGSGFPVTVSSKHLTGAVVDPQSPYYIYVCDNSGYLYAVNSSGTAEGTSSQMDFNGGFTDAPLVDSASSTSYIYTFAQHYGQPTSGDTGTFINQFSGSVSGYGNSIQVGSSTSGNITLPVYAGAFDNQHTTSSNGNLYFCALSSSSTTAYPTLYQIKMASSIGSGTVTLYNTLASAATTCSPITEFYNSTTTTDYIFLSVTASGSAHGCTGACLYNYSIPTSGSGTAGTATAGLAVTGGASGTIIDNNVPSGTEAGASQIYFFSLKSQNCPTTSSGCAVQASQSALQ
jgi:hypothetical protein